MAPNLRFQKEGKKGDNDPKDTFKLSVIGIFALSSLILTVYTVGFMNKEILLSIYPLIPHLYLIPIILLALWYPKRGLQITILLISAILILTIYLYFRGMVLDPFISLLYSGMDIAIFVVLALYAKDRTLVESFLKGFFEHSGLGEDFEESIRHPSEKAKVKFEGAFEEVVDALHSRDEEMREEAVRALGELNDPRAVEPLISILNDDNRYIRREAAKSLGRIGDERAIPPLINGLKDEDRNGREGAAEGLGEMGEKALQSLIDAMNDDDWHVRMGAAISLRIIGDKSAINPLIAALDDENRFVRREVTKSLGRIGDTRVVEPLIGTLNDPDRSVRMRAVSALAKFDDDRVIDPLIQTLNDEDSGVRLRAIRALEDIDDPRVAKALNNSVVDEFSISEDKGENQ
ncbi:MAG TPA: HEAT repeat domain-containing protein [Methanoregulaceae archaeon]|nr:HEAT repeat domain-containing protein [Methanoregulaceae archaeon]